MLHRDALINRFLKYVSFDTQSDEENDAVCPSTPGQLVLSKALADELNGLGRCIGNDQRLGIGKADVFSSADDQTAGNKGRLLTGFDHAG